MNIGDGWHNHVTGQIYTRASLVVQCPAIIMSSNLSWMNEVVSFAAPSTISELTCLVCVCVCACVTVV